VPRKKQPSKSDVSADLSNAIPEPEESKSDATGWLGGLPVKLTRKTSSGETLRDVLSQHVGETLDQELNNQATRIRDIAKWHKQYKGKKPKKSWPFERASNVAIPITRSDTDALLVRTLDALFNKQKTVIVKANDKSMIEVAPKIEEGINHWLRNIVKIKSKLLAPLIQCYKSGTGIVKVVPETRKRTVVRYATEVEMVDDTTTKYSLEGTSRKGVKVPVTTYDGPDIFPVPREDFVISSDAVEIQDAYLVGLRTYYRKPQLETKARQGYYDTKAVSKIVADDYSDNKKSATESAGKLLTKTDATKPIEVWELWLRYDVDEDGEEDDIVVCFHKESRQILRAIYNPIFSGFRPFQAFRFNPVEYQFDGEGVAEILEQLQVAIDTLVNQRIDRMTQINGPLIFVRAGGTLDNYKMAPGKVEVVDGDLEDSIKIVELNSNYYATVQEESMLGSYADRAVGITPNVLGINTAERPVAKVELSQVQEANKKFKEGIEHIRDDVAELIFMCIECFAQYTPTYKYTMGGTGQEIEQKSIDFPSEYLRDGLKVELYASSELVNQEIRREINVAVYTMLSDWMTKNAGIIQAIVSPAVPSVFKAWLAHQYESGVKLVRRIMDDYDIRDADELISVMPPDVLKRAIAQSVDLMQAPPGSETGEPPPPGAGPGEGAPAPEQMPPGAMA